MGLTRAEHVAVCMEPLTLLRPRYRQHMREQRRIPDEADDHDGARSQSHHTHYSVSRVLESVRVARKAIGSRADGS